MTAPKQIVRRLYGCIRHNHSAGFTDLVFPLHVDRSNGRDSHEGFIARHALADFGAEIQAMVAKGDTVVVRWRETGVRTGRIFSLLPTGKSGE